MFLTGKVAVVTGGARGIGREIVLTLAREGARVVIADVSEEAGLDAARAVREAGAEALFVRADVTDQTQVRSLMAQALEAFGGLDILVCNAGITFRVPFVQMSPAQWHKTIAINLTGTYQCISAALPAMLDRGGGRVIIVSSASAFTGSGGGAHYAASKAGVHGLTRALARELAPHGILVNAVAPRVIESNILDELYPSEEAKIALVSEIPVRRLGRPADVAEMVTFLASPESGYINGQVILLDGGRTAVWG